MTLSTSVNKLHMTTVRHWTVVRNHTTLLTNRVTDRARAHVLLYKYRYRARYLYWPQYRCIPTKDTHCSLQYLNQFRDFQPVADHQSVFMDIYVTSMDSSFILLSYYSFYHTCFCEFLGGPKHIFLLFTLVLCSLHQFSRVPYNTLPLACNNRRSWHVHRYNWVSTHINREVRLTEAGALWCMRFCRSSTLIGCSTARLHNRLLVLHKAIMAFKSPGSKLLRTLRVKTELS